MILRGVVIGIGSLLILGGIVLAIAVPGPGWVGAVQCWIFGGLILIGTLLEMRYHSRRSTPGAGWQTTGERFIDPTTGQLTQVRYNPATGERAYDPIDP